jgi:prevent-host-death family protein
MLIAVPFRSRYIDAMSETAVPVAEAARDFLRVLDLVETRREPATLVRDGKPVARLVPVPDLAATCGELAERWEKLERLPPDEAQRFADDIERARGSLPPLRSAWD